MITIQYLFFRDIRIFELKNIPEAPNATIYTLQRKNRPKEFKSPKSLIR